MLPITHLIGRDADFGLSTRRLLSAALLASLAGLGALGCGDAESFEEEDTDADTAAAESPLHGAPGSYWPKGPDGYAHVPVCWTFDGYERHKEWVRNAVEKNWGDVAYVKFSGWGRCDVNTPDQAVRVSMADVAPTTLGFGTWGTGPGQTAAITLNFIYDNWTWRTPLGTSGKAGADEDKSCHVYPKFCTEITALHEFGHALGMVDEATNGAGQPLSGGFDANSVMNVSPVGNTPSGYNPTNIYRWSVAAISPQDMRGLQGAYGPAPALSPVNGWGYADRRWMIDVDGDGDAEFCRATGDSGGGNSFFACTPTVTSSTTAIFWAQTSDWGYADRRWMADFNGDGKVDFCRAVGETWAPNSWLGCSYSMTTTGALATWTPIADWGYSDRRWMADVNGDGKADFCRGIDANWGVNSHLGCSLTAAATGAITTSVHVDDWGHADRRWMVDVNGDGKADFCRAVGAPWGVGSYLACSLSVTTSGEFDTLTPMADWGYSDRRWMADVNGDGKVDYCRGTGWRSGPGSYLSCTFGTPSGFSNAIDWQMQIDDWGTMAWMADVNADERAELLSDNNTPSVLEAHYLRGPMPATPAPANNLDLARGKPTAQSSTLAPEGASSNAVDGNINGAWSAGSVTHTNYELNAWWQVDLQAVQPLGQVILYNRLDCCSDRLSNFVVQVSNDGSAWTTAASYPGVAPAQLTLALTDPATGGYTSGRFVRVKLLGTNNLSLAEVMVFPPPAANLALWKPTIQSSTASGGESWRAVDGFPDGNFPSGSMSLTNAEANAWWQVDLQAIQPLGRVAIYGRTDGCPQGLASCASEGIRDFDVQISNDGLTWTTAASYSGIAPFALTLPLTSGANNGVAQGRYLRVRLQGTGALSLADVQVFAP